MNLWNNRKWGPMLLSEVQKPFNDKDFLFEVKFDGIRSLIFATSSKVVAYSRNLKDITYLFPELYKIKDLVNGKVIFDGEIVSFDGKVPSFSKLQERLHLKDTKKILFFSEKFPIVFVCFDVLYNNKDLTQFSLIERKNILKKFKDNDVFIKNKYILEDGIGLFSKVKKLHLEGIVAKKISSKYSVNTRTEDWIKVKNLKIDDYYIGGYIEKESNFVVTLILGEKKEDSDDKLCYVGKVILSKKSKLYSSVKKCKKVKNSFVDFSDSAIFIEPTLKCRVKYLEKTKNNHLRHPTII